MIIEISIQTIQIITFIVFFILLVFVFASVDHYRLKRRMKKSIKKWDQDVKESDKKNYKRKNN